MHFFDMSGHVILTYYFLMLINIIFVCYFKCHIYAYVNYRLSFWHIYHVTIMLF